MQDTIEMNDFAELTPEINTDAENINVPETYEGITDERAQIDSSDSYRQELSDMPQSELELLLSALDAILLVNNKPIPVEKLAEILEISPEAAHELVMMRKHQYDEDSRSGLQVVLLDSGIELATKAKVSDYIKKMDGQKLVSLSLPALETLSVIAFKQPVTKAEVDAVRGVNCDGVISTLLEKKLIYISGEKKVIGRPRLYSTTQDFLYYFGIKNLNELPRPVLDFDTRLLPEDGSPEYLLKEQNTQKEFNESQGFLPIEEDD